MELFQPEIFIFIIWATPQWKEGYDTIPRVGKDFPATINKRVFSNKPVDNRGQVYKG